MRLLLAALATALTVASAQAQLMGPGGQIAGSQIGQHAQQRSEQSNKTAAERKNEERAYNSALGNLPDKQFDPWHGVR